MYTSYRNSSRNQNSFSWTWIIAGGVILGIIVLKWLFGGTQEAEAGDYLLITPSGADSSVYISMSAASKNQISAPEKLYATDKSVSVNAGGAIAENGHLQVDLDKSTELTYVSASQAENTISVSKGRGWIVAKDLPVMVNLKHFSFRVQPGGIALVEQNNAYSSVYSIKGTTILSTEANGTYNLEAGNRIMVGASDVASSTPFSSLSGPIDESIMQNVLFQRNNGSSYLSQIPTTSSGSTSGTDSLSTSGTTVSSGGKFIEITDPIDGSIAKSSSITIMGKILSKEVKRVTIDDRDSSVSPVNESFVIQNVALEKDINNFVYKAYDDNNSLLEKGVVVVFATKGARDTQNKLISNTFPISNKDFKITFPTENPYKTIDSVVKVQGSVPKGTVSYIVVNDYRLQMFSPGGTSWYYYANMDFGSMSEGINLYTIKFYSSDNTLLYSQLFTIVKESKNATVSGEAIR